MNYRPPYGRDTARESFPAFPRQTPIPEGYQGQTYCDYSPIKPGRYGELISAYFFLGGLSGGSQILAALANLLGGEQDRSMVRNGRYLGLVGSLASPILLIADLESPRRWYNMLRIFRPTSAMSIGSWTLAAFGTMSGIAAVSQALEDLTGTKLFRRVATWSGTPAGVLGGQVSTYTAVLVSSTSNPLWAAADKSLPVLFGSSAMSTAAAALSLAEHFGGGSPATKQRLEKISLVCGAVELAASAVAEYQWRSRGVRAPLEEEPLASVYRIGFHTLGLLAPLAVHAVGTFAGRRSKTVSMLASVATLAGSFALRSWLVHGGKRSAQTAPDYFRFTQPMAAEAPDAAWGRGRCRVESIPSRSSELAPAKARSQSAGATHIPQSETPPQRQKPPAMAAMWDKAMSALSQAMDAAGTRVDREVEEAENMVAAMRDRLIERLRANGHSTVTPQEHEALGCLNAALSYIVALEYPATGVHREALDKARDALKKVPTDALRG